MLVVVEHRDVQPLSEPALDLEAGRRGDVLEVDAAKAHRDPCDGLDRLLDGAGLDDDGERGHAGEIGEQQRLPLHHRQRGERADVAEAEDRGPIGDDRDRIRPLSEGPRPLGVGRDREGHSRDTGRVHQREVVAIAHRDSAGHRDLAAQMHEERAIGYGADDDAVHVREVGGELLPRRLVRHVDGHIADMLLRRGLDQVDRAEAAATRADGPCDLREHAGTVIDLEPDDEAIRR